MPFVYIKVSVNWSVKEIVSLPLVKGLPSFKLKRAFNTYLDKAEPRDVVGGRRMR